MKKVFFLTILILAGIADLQAAASNWHNPHPTLNWHGRYINPISFGTSYGSSEIYHPSTNWTYSNPGRVLSKQPQHTYGSSSNNRRSRLESE